MKITNFILLITMLASFGGAAAIGGRMAMDDPTLINGSLMFQYITPYQSYVIGIGIMILCVVVVLFVPWKTECGTVI